MHTTINNFVQYEGISEILPSILNTFQCISYPFFIQIPNDFTPIHTLNKVCVKVKEGIIDHDFQQFNISSTLSSLKLPLSILLEVTIYYTSIDLTHSVHSIVKNLSITDFIYYDQNQNFISPNLSLFVEDIFAYCLDPTYIYGHIFLLASLE